MATTNQLHEFLARVERHEITGDVTLHLIEDNTEVELTEGAEYMTVLTQNDPFESREAS